MKMDTAKQHWPILGRLGPGLANRVRKFMVIGELGKGMIVVTENGQGFWFGRMDFGWSKSKTTTELIPLNVPELVQMAQGIFQILLLNKRGEIYSMGKNDLGQLGLGTEDKETHYSPQLILSPHKFISVRCGVGHSVALTEDGKCWAWGDNYFGQVGVSSSTRSFPYPRQISELDSHRIVAVECGDRHSLALTDRGEVYGWGANDCGQLEGGSKSINYYEWNRSRQLIPTRILTPSPVQSMAAGDGHTLLLTLAGEVYARGNNQFGQLGLPTTRAGPNKSGAFINAGPCSVGGVIRPCHLPPYPEPTLCKVAGLPPISQIASHSFSPMSIAMSFDKRCFVWGKLNGAKFDTMGISMSIPLKLPSVYSTVESPLSFFSSHPFTPNSVQITATPLSPLSARMSRMFDNPAASPDVQFVVEQRTIHAHRIILSNSSDYFAQKFAKTWLCKTDPIVKVTIPDHSYQVFHSFLRFLYTDYLEVYSQLLPEMFELASKYLVPELQQLCLSRMRTTLTPTTCCLYYPLTHRHSLLPELATFQQELVQFVCVRKWKIADTAAYQSMEPDIRDNFTNALQNSEAILFATSNLISKTKLSH